MRRRLREWCAWRKMRRAATEFLSDRKRAASMTCLGIKLASLSAKGPERVAHLSDQEDLWTEKYHFRDHQLKRLMKRRVR